MCLDMSVVWTRVGQMTKNQIITPELGQLATTKCVHKILCFKLMRNLMLQYYVVVFLFMKWRSI